MKTPPFNRALKRFAATLFVVTFTIASTCAGSITLFPPDTLEGGDWTVVKYSNPQIGAVEFHDEQWLAIGRAATNNGSGQVMYTGEGSQLANFSGSVVFGVSSSSSGYGTGVMLRAAGTTFNNTSSYFLGVLPGQSKLGLYWGGGDSFLPPSSPSSWADLKSTSLAASLGALSSTQNNQYLLEFSFIDNLLTASISVWDPETGGKGALLGELDFTEDDPTRPASGYFGVRGGRYGGNVTSYFRDVQVQAVPEPSTLAMILVSAGGGILCRRMARR